MDKIIEFEPWEEEFDAEMDEKIEVIRSDDYNDLENKPQINNIELVGNTTLEDLGVVSSDVTIAGFPLTGDVSRNDLKIELGVNDKVSDFPDASDYVKATDTESDDINFEDFDW